MKISRNAMCPCGSGKKYKKCCISSSSKLEEIFSTGNLPFTEVPPRSEFPELSEEFLNSRLANESEFYSQKILYSLLTQPALVDLTANFAMKMNPRGKPEATRIKKCQTPEELVGMISKGIDILNEKLMTDRLLETPEKSVLLLLELLRGPGDDMLHEFIIKYFVKAETNVTDELIEIIMSGKKSLYHVSILCILLGFQKDFSVMPFLWDMSEYFQKKYPNETLWCGPFLGLWELWIQQKEMEK